jgi:hypothetical protein
VILISLTTPGDGHTELLTLFSKAAEMITRARSKTLPAVMNSLGFDHSLKFMVLHVRLQGPE